MNAPELKRPSFDLAAFKADIDGIRCHEEKAFVASKSKDFSWFSPILKEDLEGLTADIVVVPKDQDEVVRVAAAVARHGVPLTLRGAGTGNYGQCVPLAGGVVMVMTGLDRIIEMREGGVLVEAGMRLGRLDEAAHETGQELLMYPSTIKTATVGGFIAGGSGGNGSLRNGMLRDPGNVSYVKIVSVETEPRIIELRDDEIQKVQHAYGTNGIMVEIDCALTKAQDWLHSAVLFDGYDKALRFSLAAQEEGLDLYLLAPVDKRFAPYYKRFGELFPDDRDAVFTMVAPDALDRFSELAREMDGRISFAMRMSEIEEAGLQPAYECGWNHTTLQVLKSDKGWTYLQVAYPVPFDVDLVVRQMERYGDEIYWHHELARMDGELQTFALPLVRYTGRERMYQLIAEMEELDGCTIYDPHVVTIEDGGMKEIDSQQIEFKRRADPYGLMNPGKTRGWTDDMARRD